MAPETKAAIVYSLIQLKLVCALIIIIVIIS